MNTIIVTGGLGFIGSHICVELLSKNYNVIIIDNLENSSLSVYDRILHISQVDKCRCNLIVLDLTNMNALTNWFSDIIEEYNITGIIHCAGKKAVNESIHKPLLYYRDNLTMTLNILECMDKYDIENFVFSSSATVYGTANGNATLYETSKVGSNITNPYGKTKYMQEEIIRDFAKNHHDKCFIILRYFNPVGAHESGLIGENPRDIPNNLMPYIIRVAAHNADIGFPEKAYEQLTIFGNDYNTYDGTCVRDFIHVVDLARAHCDVLVFENKASQSIWTFNVGTGHGTSVQEIVDAFAKENNTALPYKYGVKREGDIPVVVCDCSLIDSTVGWSATHTLHDIVRSAWNFALVHKT